MVGIKKADGWSVAFSKTAAGAAEIKAGTSVDVSGSTVQFASATSISMPTLTAGNDYAIFVSSSGSIQAVAWTANTGVDPTPPASGGPWECIGGFHYAPGGNATGWNTGGNATPQIDEYTFWDLSFRPKCPDPRGMMLVAGMFWIDYYLLGVDHHINGTSRHNVAIATGTVKPKIPAMFGGNGSDLVTQMDWHWTGEIFHSHGKRFPSWREFQTAAFGVIEELSRDQAPVTTGLNTTNNSGATYKDQAYTGIWGGNLMAGSHYIWTGDLTYGTHTGLFDASGSRTPSFDPGYYALYNGRGRGTSPVEDLYSMRALLVGGKYGVGVASGSGSVDAANAVQTHSASISARGAADHLLLF